MEKGSSEIEILVISRDGEEKKTDKIIHEQEVVVRFGREIHKFFCIPANLEELITGNLKSRGLNPSFTQIREIGDSNFEVDVSEEPARNPQRCDSNKKLTSEEVFNSVEMLNQNSFLYKETGCTHVVGICGDKEIFAEDISRHCAIDKAIGLAIRDGIDLSKSFLVTSCRQTASTIKKAIFCGIPIVISIAAPTDLAIKEANEYGITLIGFASPPSFNTYSHDWRIKI